jgi:hypothetical protein
LSCGSAAAQALSSTYAMRRLVWRRSRWPMSCLARAIGGGAGRRVGTAARECNFLLLLCSIRKQLASN